MPKMTVGDLKEALEHVFDSLPVYIATSTSDDGHLESVMITLEGVILSQEESCMEDYEDVFNREEWEQDFD